MEASSRPFYFDAHRTVFFNRQIGAIENSKGNQYPLSTQPFLALSHLCDHPRQIVAWRQIWTASHPETEAYESDSYARARAIIGELRRVLAAAGVENPHKLIETKRGRGVILNSPLKLSNSDYTYAYLTLAKPMKYFGERVAQMKFDDDLLGAQIKWFQEELSGNASVEAIPTSLDVARLYIALKSTYNESSNATILFSKLRDSILGDAPAVVSLRAAESKGIAYSSIGYIFELLALSLINTGFQPYMTEARTFLDRAIKIYLNLFDFSIESLKHVVSAQWLRSLTHKVEGNTGLAREACFEILEFHRHYESDIPLRFSESAIIPIREIATLDGNDALLSELAFFMASDPEADPRERFFTVKRALESAIVNQNEEKSRQLVGTVLDSYSKCWRSVDAYHVIDLAKDILAFYALSGECVKATTSGDHVLKSARELGLTKQVAEVQAVLQSIVAPDCS